jgi:tellurite resistance protein TehA-like permease
VPRTGRSTRAERPHTPPHLLHRQSGVLGWLERATLHTVPHYFAITMGTGISSILLHNFPYPARWLQYLGTIVFALNVLAFVVILAFTIARYACWTGVWGVVLKHNVTSMFWGCFPMGLATIIVSRSESLCRCVERSAHSYRI